MHLGLAELPYGGHPEGTVQVDVQLHPGQRLRGGGGGVKEQRR